MSENMSSKPQLLVLIPLPPPFLRQLALAYAVHQVAPGADLTVLALSEICAVLTNGSTGLSAAQMAQLPALGLICSYGAGHENIDLAAAHARGIAVTHAPGVNNATVADHALALMLAISRGLPVLDRSVKAGAWQTCRAERPTLNGKRLGLLGLGNIGEHIARRAAAFDMTIGYHTRQVRQDSPYRHYPTLAALAEHSDYLVLACPGGAATRHLVNADILKKLGADGFLINIARGSVVDTPALIAALRAETIAGAALDVLETEPDVPEALRHLDNVILTPHISGRSPEAQLAQQAMFVRNFNAHLAGQALLHTLVAA
jgi:lactate dehydrogenase-like 2-hydroxyacid dehydrogenase